MKNIIDFVKWQDPLETHVNNVKKAASAPVWSDSDHDGDIMSMRGGVGPCVVGPMGVIPVNESNIPGRLFNFWMGHTNFDLRNGWSRALTNVDGVETIDFISRYRFRVGIGKLFAQDQVMDAMKACVAAVPVTAPLPTAVDRLRASLAAKYPHWAIWRLPNGQLRPVGGKTPEEVRRAGAGFGEGATEVLVSW